jgi:hypothetical protein
MTSKGQILPDRLFYFDAVIGATGDWYFPIMEKSELGAVQPGTSFMRNQGGRWHYLGEVGWNVVSVSPQPDRLEGMVGGGSDGEIVYVTKGSINQANLSDVYDGPFTLRRIKALGQQVIAVGYGGVIFILDNQSRWTYEKFSEPSEQSWIESVAFDPGGNKYLVGLKGEMWSNFGGQMVELESPTNEDLNDVCCAQSGDIYVCGANGTLMIGQKHRWKCIVPPIETGEDFWRVTECLNKIWVSSVNHVYQCENDNLVLSDFGIDLGVKSYYNLRSHNNELIVVDENMVVTYDGDRVQKVF